MFSVDAVNWIVEAFQVHQLSLDILEAVLMFDCVNRAGQILDVVQVFLNLSIFVLSVDFIDRIRHVFQVMYFPLYVLEDVRALFNVEHRSNQIHNILHFFLHLIEVVVVINILPHWEVHLLESVKALEDLLKVVSPVNFVNRVV